MSLLVALCEHDKIVAQMLTSQIETVDDLKGVFANLTLRLTEFPETNPDAYCCAPCLAKAAERMRVINTLRVAG